MSYRDGARVFAGIHSSDPVSFDLIESVLDAWRDLGLSISEAAQRTALLRDFIVGFCIEAQSLAELRDEDGQKQITDMESVADPKRFPLAAQALPILLSTTADDHFELGLRLMLSDAGPAGK